MRLFSGVRSAGRRRLIMAGAAAAVLLAGGIFALRGAAPSSARAELAASFADDAEERRSARRAARSQGVPELWWEALGELNYQTGEMPDSLRALDGQIVRIPGFMVPLDDYAARVSEFLLVPYPGACVHVPPPPPNLIVYARMENQRHTNVTWWDPIWIEGRLSIQAVESVYGPVGYQFEVMHIEPYEEEDDY
jgi:uncharacterized protein